MGADAETKPRKYDELCDAYGAARERWFEHRRACRDFLVHVVELLEHDWEAPPLEYWPLVGDPDESVEYSAIGAMHAEEDGFFHMGVVLTLCDPPDRGRPQEVIIRLCVKKVDRTCYLRVGRDGDVREIAPGDDASILAVLDELHRAIKASYDTDLERFLRDAPAARPEREERRIGFSTEPSLHEMKPVGETPTK